MLLFKNTLTLSYAIAYLIYQWDIGTCDDALSNIVIDMAKTQERTTLFSFCQHSETLRGE